MKQEVYFEADGSREISMSYCGTEICSADFYVPPHIRQEFLIHYILSGSGNYHTPQRDYRLEAGDVFLIYPGLPVSYETNAWDPLNFSWFGFTGQQAEATIEKLGFERGSCVRRLHSRYSIHSDILACMDMVENQHAFNPFILMSYLYKMIGLISESYLMDTNSKLRHHNIVQEHIRRASTYIRLNYMKSISVADIVDFVGLERTYFSKIFRENVGMTAQTYLQQVRISQAKLFLEQTSYSIKEITAFVGFQDECYFSRVFKKLEGMSPLAYRTLAEAHQHTLTEEKERI